LSTFAPLQATPHAPQFRTSVAGVDSQPSLTMLLQSWKPDAQPAMVQVRLTQAGVPFDVVQVLSQVPQLVTSLATQTP
jgi:hypothetical protein